MKKIWKNTFYFKLKALLFSRLLIQSFTLFLLPSRKLPLFCSFSDVIECLTTYGKGCFLKYLKNNNEYLLALWCSGYHYCTMSFNKAWTQVLHRFKSCLWHVGDLWWWVSLTMVPAGNKTKQFSWSTIPQKQFIIIITIIKLGQILGFGCRNLFRYMYFVLVTDWQ